MNKTEQRYSQMLSAYNVEWWAFEKVKLSLGHHCWYTPDFVCIRVDGTVCMVDVKAGDRAGKAIWTDDARVKIKAAARAYPWLTFIAVHEVGRNNWVEEEIQP